MTEEYRLIPLEDYFQNGINAQSAKSHDQSFFNSESNTESELLIYHMRGIDSACPTLTYHYWRVNNSPDETGVQAGTLPCGGPLTNIVVIKIEQA